MNAPGPDAILKLARLGPKSQARGAAGDWVRHRATPELHGVVGLHANRGGNLSPMKRRSRKPTLDLRALVDQQLGFRSSTLTNPYPNNQQLSTNGPRNVPRPSPHRSERRYHKGRSEAPPTLLWAR